MSRVKPSFKVWLETERGYVFGEGPFEILRLVHETGTLSEAARLLGMSYRHAWGMIKRIERIIGKPLLKTKKGGRVGGGGAELTEAGVRLLREFSRVKEVFSRIYVDEFMMEDLTNYFGGRVVSIDETERAVVIEVKVDAPFTMKSVMAKETLYQLNINVGDEVVLMVKAKDLGISKV